MTSTTERIPVTVNVSRPYTKIAGGWTGMRPVGRRRDYTATVAGKQIKNTSKDEICRIVRLKLHPARPVFTFVEES